jgi:alkyldihydroxyacetonephosphate synthase
MSHLRHELRWNGWGRRAVAFEFHGREEAAWKVVAEALGGAALPETPAVPLSDARLPESRLSAAQQEGLERLTARDRVKTDRFERALHALGRSYHDLLRLRAGDLSLAPDAVVYPERHDEVVSLLGYCDAERLAVVPFGGGSSVVGGVTGSAGPHGAVVTIDLSRMTKVDAVDRISRTVRADTGVYGPELEAQLGEQGYTMGHFPQSFEYSTLGGWIAARGAGQLSNRYGTARDRVVALTMASPRGVLRTGAFPSSAAGPNLNGVLAGSEGTLGILTSAVMRVDPVAPHRRIVAFLFRTWDDGVAAIRTLVQDDVGAAMLRLSDPDETHFFGAFRRALEPSLLMRGVEGTLGRLGFANKCVLIAAFEGTREETGAKLARAREVARVHRGLFVGSSPGRSWWKRRFEMPFLRDPMLDRGIGIDTLETATTWSALGRLYGAVRSALVGAADAHGHEIVVMAHISHSYPDGASLYFTFLFRRDEGRAIAQWRTLKDAASRAIADHGGTISHHHGVGEDHASYLGAEKGALGLEALRGLKDRLDPHGIMNPGKLLPA